MDNTLKTVKTLRGIPASSGIAIGPAFIYQEMTLDPELRSIADEHVSAEVKRFKKAIKASREYLQKISDESGKIYGKEYAEIIHIQISILEDKIFLDEVELMIKEKKIDAAYATFRVFQNKKEYFLRLTDEYFRERAFDIQNLKRLILKKLMGKKLEFHFPERSIIVADNVNPAEIIRLHNKNILGFCTNVGGKNSHTAIVARSLGVPAVVGTENITRFVTQGDIVVVDGNEGVILVNPDESEIQTYQEKKKKILIVDQNLRRDAEKPAETRDGKRIQVMGNIEFVEELVQLKKSGAEGIGLFRTEGLFLSGTLIPSEDIQTDTYLRYSRAAQPFEVIIRTLDVGGDKILPDVVTIPEGNPFLGWRAIRFCLDHKDIFVPQLKAILRANISGNVRLLLPMISSLEEIRQVKSILREVHSILSSEGKAFNPEISIGMMVEIPAAAIMIEDFIQEIDFLSIGTNDLVQYTLAVDRANEKISHLYNHFHPAHLQLIKKVIDAGKKHNILVSMCGEMAGDPVAIPLLVGMGLENLSTAHYRVPEIKNVIRHVSTAECVGLYQQVNQLKTTHEIQTVCENFYSNIFTVSHVSLNKQRPSKFNKV